MANKTPRLGTISEGTLRTQDLLPEFLAQLRHYDRDAFDACGSIPEEADADDSAEWWGSEEAEELLLEVTDALTAVAPPYAYFGAHSGDGADFGFWLSDDWQEQFDGLKVSDTSEVPDGYSGEVLHVNDHGNATLYSADNGKLTEVWAIV